MRRIAGFGSHILVLLLAAAGGAAGVWLLQQRQELEAVTTHGEWTWFPSGADSVRAYVAYPERSDAAPAVIVIHEIMGLTDWEPTVADRLAASGYVAIAPDMLSSRFGQTPATADSARKLMAQLTSDGVNADLDAAYAYLNGLPAVTRDAIGVIGFCWGGSRSFNYATANPRLRAAVVCYGSAPDSAAMSRIGAPVLGVYGENDARINNALPEVERQMTALNKRFAHDIYPGTGHGFLKPGRRGNDTDQPDRAWERILAFFNTELGR